MLLLSPVPIFLPPSLPPSLRIFQQGCSKHSCPLASKEIPHRESLAHHLIQNIRGQSWPLNVSREVYIHLKMIYRTMIVLVRLALCIFPDHETKESTAEVDTKSPATYASDASHGRLPGQWASMRPLQGSMAPIRVSRISGLVWAMAIVAYVAGLLVPELNNPLNPKR